MSSVVAHPANESDSLLFAFCVAFCLHVAAILLLPHLEHAPAPMPMRVEIDLTQSPPVAAALPQPMPQPEVVKPEPPKPIPRPVVTKPVVQPQQQAMPVLTARDNSPPTLRDAVVSNPVMPAPVAIVPSAPASPPTDAAPADPPKASSNVAAATTRSNEADSDEAWQGYGQLLYDMVTKNKTYPQIAIRRHLQGQARVSARFSQGRLIELILLEPGSGHQVLDNAALEMMKRAVSALPINGDLAKKSFTVIVPVEFKIDG